MKKLTRTLLLTGTMTLLPIQASAEKIYESVGPSGEVIFSDRKPADAVEVKELEMAPEEPAPEAVKESQRRTQQMIERANRSQEQRDAEKAQRAEALKAARQRVKEAEARLKEAEEIGEGDRLGTAGGGSRLTPEYFSRVEAARAELESARKALKAARNH